MSTLRFPLTTYRLQFNQYFTFSQAQELVDYFYDLGITDYYASPIMKSQSGSLHGYDVLDHHQINPLIGTEEELGKLISALQQRGMGLLLDIVPNHMSIAESGNKWWNDVLENGPSSIYANYFNIVWDPPKPKLKNKILLSVLDQQYGKVIENQEIKIVYDGGAFFAEFKQNRFPVNPRTWSIILEPVVKQLESKLGESDPDFLELQSILTALDHLPKKDETDIEKCKERNREKEIIKKRLINLTEDKPIIRESIQESLNQLNGIKGDPDSFNRLEQLLDDQAYRLSYWRVTNDEINYHRFFDVNSLASMRVEEEEIFAAIHEFYFKLVKQGWVTGFRIDHVDGLFDPEQYLNRLQQACQLALGDQAKQNTNQVFYTVVEKILVGQEKLREQWLTFGTTGYDFLNLLNGVFVKCDQKQTIQQIYDQFIGRHEEMTDTIYECKKLILIVSMSSELHMLARHLEEISEQHRWSRDFTFEGLRSALRDVIACFPVYRSYIRTHDAEVNPIDKEYIIAAIQQAKRLNPAIDLSIFDFIQSVFLLEDPLGLNEDQIAHRREFVMRLQQLTGPVTAKGFEDTAFYRHYPLASLNEVGMDPDGFGTTLEDFHQKNSERRRLWPHTMLATFTHDTKRSEDVRARINVLSEDPVGWNEALHRWQKYNQDKKIVIDKRKVPDRNEEYLLYQTLIGSWPLYLMDASARANYINRIEGYMMKALKEAKVHTSWINPNENYEKAVKDFIHAILDLDSTNQFLTDFISYIQPILRPGMFNSLAQTLLKMTCPGVPDFYQGSELWEFTLVDPDNRRPVDYSTRKHLLSKLKEKAQEDPLALVNHLMETPEDGRIKLYLTMKILHFRREHPQLFQEGEYQMIKVEGEKQDHMIAFGRHYQGQQMIVAAGRFYKALVKEGTHLPIGESIWKDTDLSCDLLVKGLYRNILSGQELIIEDNARLAVANLFAHLPFALIEKIG